MIETLWEYLGVAKTLYGDYLREVGKEEHFLVSVVRFVLVILNLPLTLPVMIAIIHLINTGNEEIYKQMKDGK